MGIYYQGIRYLDHITLNKIDSVKSVSLDLKKYPCIFNWGGHGSACALLSLVILSDYTQSTDTALSLYPDFLDVIASIKTPELVLTSNDIDQFLSRFL